MCRYTWGRCLCECLFVTIFKASSLLMCAYVHSRCKYVCVYASVRSHVCTCAFHVQCIRLDESVGSFEVTWSSLSFNRRRTCCITRISLHASFFYISKYKISKRNNGKWWRKIHIAVDKKKNEIEGGHSTCLELTVHSSEHWPGRSSLFLLFVFFHFVFFPFSRFLWGLPRRISKRLFLFSGSVLWTLTSFVKVY